MVVGEWLAGWWFGTWLLLFHSVGNNNPNWRTPSFFQRGRLNHQPVFFFIVYWIITIIIIPLYVYIYIGIGQWWWRICQADPCFFDLTIKSTVFENRDGVSKKLDILSTIDGDVELSMICLCITKNWWTLSPSSSAQDQFTEMIGNSSTVHWDNNSFTPKFWVHQHGLASLDH